MFDPTSRYRNVPDAETVLPDGRKVTCKRRRFLPDPAALRILAETASQPGDRIDRVAARAYGNPELWWLIADASGAVDPGELTETPGTPLRMPFPEPGA